MKKIFTLLLIAAAWSQTSVAQNYGVLLFEGFESGAIPVGWTQELQDPPLGIASDGWAFGETSYTSSSWAVPASLDNSQFALSNDDVEDQDRFYDLLKTPVLNLTHFDSTVFLFDVFFDGTNGSGAYFMISYDAGANWLNLPLDANATWMEDGAMLPNTITVGGTDYVFNDQMMVGFLHTDNDGPGSGLAIDNVLIAGYNNPCNDIITISACNEPHTVTLGGQGVGDFNFESPCYDVPGAEQLYSFTPTVTGTHVLSITSTTENSWLDYMYKEASTGCDTLGWICLGDMDEVGNLPLTLTAGTEYYILVDNEFSDTETQTFSISCPAAPGTPCLITAATWGDLNSAPCGSGGLSDAGFVSVGIYGSETYELANVQAGYDYVFDMCSGFGAGSWIPEIAIIAPDGTTIDAWNGEAATGSSLTFVDQCTLAWTATQSGTYSISINELGTAEGDAPNQVDCFTSYAVSNGNPTVSTGANAAPCAACEAGTLTSPLVQDVCPGESFEVALSGNSTPGSYTLYFDNTTTGGTGGIESPVSITNYGDSDFPLELDADLNGVLSFNNLPELAGSWEVKVIVVDGSSSKCDSTDTFVVNFLEASDPACTPVGVNENEAAHVSVYPNPSNGSFTVEMDNMESFATLVVMDVAGREVYSQTIAGSGTLKQVLDLDLKAGSYMLQVASGQKQHVTRIVIQ